MFCCLIQRQACVKMWELHAVVLWDYELDLLWGGWDTHFLKSLRVASKQSDCGDWSAGSHYPGIKSPLSHNLLSRLFCFFYNYARFIIWKFQNNHRGGWWASADRARMAVVRFDLNFSSNFREINIFFNFFSTYFISTTQSIIIR